MVSVVNCKMEEFKEKTHKMDIFCFGAGKYFKKFISENPDIHLSGVIDNYYQKDEITIGNRKYPLYSIEEFSHMYNKRCAVVVTVRAFEEIIDQLDNIKKLDGMLCFLWIALNNYSDLANEQKYIFKNQIDELSQRKNKEENHITDKKENHYQIWEYYEKSNIGGSKARTDICKILRDYGYIIRKVHCSGITGDTLMEQQMLADWKGIFDSIEEGSTIFIQHPSPTETKLPESLLKKMKYEKKVRFIVLVHEVESLRKEYDSCYRKEEFEVILSIGDVFIVHNDKMRQFYIDRGIEASHVISLGVFDYLNSQVNIKKVFERSVTIAANLDLSKSPYLLQLKKLENLKIHLYGPNYTDNILEKAVNIKYYGSLPTEIIPLRLDRGFGLVWDGNSIETCSGGTGEYLRYNNPHKMSLYLSSGLPVIIWREAAQAQFVEKNKVGFCIDSLYDIYDVLQHFSEEQYRFYVQNAERMSQTLKEGGYIKTAVRKAEEILCPKYL